MSGLKSNRKEFTDTLYLMLLQGVNQFLPVLVMPYLMIRLGASGYGHVGFALSVIQYLTLVVDFGFNLSATKHIALVADHEAERTRVFWNVVVAKTLLLLASSSVLAVLLLTVPTFRTYGSAILATWPMVLGSAFTFMWFFQGIGRVRLFSVINTVSKLALLPLIFVFVKSPDDYALAAFLQATVFVSTAVISNIYIARRHLVGAMRVDFKGVKEEVRTSFPLFLSTASTSVYTQLVVVILGFYCTADEVGRYSSAERIMRAVCFLLYVPLSQVFFPKLSALSQRNRGEAVGLFRQVRLLVGGVMIAVGIGLYAGGPLLPSVLGADYVGIDLYLRIFAFAPLFIGLGGVYGQMGLVALGNDFTARRFRDVYFVAAVVAITLMFGLTPWWHSVGACVAVTFTEWLVMALMMFNFKRYHSLCS